MRSYTDGQSHSTQNMQALMIQYVTATYDLLFEPGDRRSPRAQPIPHLSFAVPAVRGDEG